jgi:hypothetical protein
MRIGSVCRGYSVPQPLEKKKKIKKSQQIFRKEHGRNTHLKKTKEKQASDFDTFKVI